jgi:hypothetical protein
MKKKDIIERLKKRLDYVDFKINFLRTVIDERRKYFKSKLTNDELEYDDEYNNSIAVAVQRTIQYDNEEKSLKDLLELVKYGSIKIR